MAGIDLSCKYCTKILANEKNLKRHMEKFCKKRYIANLDNPKIDDDIIKYMEYDENNDITSILMKSDKLQDIKYLDINTLIDDASFIKIFENEPLIAFGKYINAIENIYKSEPIIYIFNIVKLLHIDIFQHTSFEKDVMLSLSTCILLSNFFDQYRKFKFRIDVDSFDNLMFKYYAFERIRMNKIMPESEFKRKFREYELLEKPSEKEEDNLYIIESIKKESEFENMELYNIYKSMYDNFSSRRICYDILYKKYIEEIDKYKTEPYQKTIKFISDFDKILIEHAKERYKIIDKLKQVQDFLQSIASVDIDGDIDGDNDSDVE